VCRAEVLFLADGLRAQAYKRSSDFDPRRPGAGSHLGRQRRLALHQASSSLPVRVAQSGLVTLPSKYSVADTTDRLEAAVKSEPDFLIFGRVDYFAIAAAQGAKVRPSQLLLFGRGRALQTLLSAAPVPADVRLAGQTTRIVCWSAAAGGAGSRLGHESAAIGLVCIRSACASIRYAKLND